MDFRQLEVFRAVMDSGSATAAARLLQMSQPAVSRHLGQIEAELGLELFIRAGGRLKPTADAAALYDEASYAFESIERVLNLARRMRGRDSGVLRVASPFVFGEALLPRIVDKLSRQHPQLRFTIEFGGYEAIETMVAKRQVDIGILKQPLAHPGLASWPLADCGTVCVLPPAHPLARGSGAVTVAALAREPLVLLGRDTTWRSDLQALLRQVPRAPTVRIDTHSAAAVCGFVAQGLGVSVLPALLAAQFAGRALVMRALEAPIRHRFVVACATSLQHSPLVAEFARAARDAAEALLGPAAAPAQAALSPSGQSRM